MNLIQITEQLKNPAVSVQQLMQYANNSNPQVPSYVALAEMQRRQSMQAPPQAPQQTVKDQLGAQLMGLPAAAPQAPQQPPQQPQPQGMQPPQQGIPQQTPQQAPTGAPQAPMPQPRQAQPTPGMAGGGLTSIPLNMHHDFAAGGIIAFADGGETDLAAQYPEQSTIEQERAERLRQQGIYGFGGDPYAEAKRRYAELEARQNAREKNADSDRLFSGLAAYAAAGPKSFAEAAGGAAQHMERMEKEQEAEGDARRAKMAELNTLWSKEQDALARANYAADKGNVQEKRDQLLKAANYRAELRKVAAQETTASASSKQAETQAREQKFKEENYPKEYELERLKTEADVARARRPDEFQQRLNLFKTNPQAYNAMYGPQATGKGVLTQDQMMDNWQKMGIQEKLARKARAGGDILKAEQDYYREVKGVASPPAASGVTVTAPNGQTYSFPNAQAAEEFKKKAGIQ